MNNIIELPQDPEPMPADWMKPFNRMDYEPKNPLHWQFGDMPKKKAVEKIMKLNGQLSIKM